jgi:hypothetical protein
MNKVQRSVWTLKELEAARKEMIVSQAIDPKRVEIVPVCSFHATAHGKNERKVAIDGRFYCLSCALGVAREINPSLTEDRFRKLVDEMQFPYGQAIFPLSRVDRAVLQNVESALGSGSTPNGVH